MALLPCHVSGPSTERWDLASHGTSAWGYALEAAQALGYGDEAQAVAAVLGLPEAVTNWRRDDQLSHVLAALRAEMRAA
jgi:hypothetical protein